MQKDNFFLNLHNKFMKRGEINEIGLCGVVMRAASSNSEEYRTFMLFMPTDNDFNQLIIERLSSTYWAYGGRVNDNVNLRAYKYTELRQTIMLFCHEIVNSSEEI